MNIVQGDVIEERFSAITGALDELAQEHHARIIAYRMSVDDANFLASEIKRRFGTGGEEPSGCGFVALEWASPYSVAPVVVCADVLNGHPEAELPAKLSQVQLALLNQLYNPRYAYVPHWWGGGDVRDGDNAWVGPTRQYNSRTIEVLWDRGLIEPEELEERARRKVMFLHLQVTWRISEKGRRLVAFRAK